MEKISLRKLFRTPSKPKVHIDVMKIIAIFMVLFNHSGNSGYSMYQDVLEQPWHWLILANSLFIKIAVPLFFMSSGALLLGREESYKKIFFQRFLRFAVTLILASFIVYNLNTRGVGPFTPITDWKTASDFLTRLYTNRVSFPFWYLYSYLGFLLMSPLLHKIAVNMKDQDFLWVIIAFILTQIFPVIDEALFHGSYSHTSYFQLFVDAKYVAYPLVGYYLENKLDKRYFTPEALFVLICLTVMAIGGSCVLVDWYYERSGQWSGYVAECCINGFTIIPALTVYFGLKMFTNKYTVHPQIARTLSIISTCTFGVYLYELILRLRTTFIFKFFKPYVGTYFAAWLQMLCACVIGVALTYIWKILLGVLNLYKQKAIDRIRETGENASRS